jgi:steroid 5-alpha reductase family enzyme
MRARDGERFWLTSLYRVFLVQAATMWVISLPLQAAGSLGAGRGLGAIDAIGAAVWLVGFGFEALGDLQLDRFKADPESRGRVMDRGLWRYTRHPNYFGDATLWWGLGLIGLGAGAGAAWGLVGSALDTLILTRVSGKPILERDIETRRPGYRDYIERTSGFVPRPPRRR